VRAFDNSDSTRVVEKPSGLLDLFGRYRWRRQADALSDMEDGGIKERFGNHFNVWSQENGVQLVDTVDLKADLKAYIPVSEF
jgi:hypothetical protein